MSKKTRKTTSDETTSAPQAPAPETNVGAALAALEAKSDEAPETNVGAALAVLGAKSAEAPETTGAHTRPLSELSYVLAPPGAQSDALGGRIGGRTQLAHVVLCESAASATNDDLKLLSTRVISERASLLSLSGAVKNAPSHLNTMKGRRFVVRVNNSWALSNRARKLVQLAPLAALVAHETAQYGAPTDAQ